MDEKNLYLARSYIAGNAPRLSPIDPIELVKTPWVASGGPPFKLTTAGKAELKRLRLIYAKLGPVGTFF